MGAKSQKRISYHDGKGWEGVAYTQVAEQFALHKPIVAEAPMVYRVGTPFLVSKISPDNLLRGFEIVNLLANFVSLALLIVWLRLYLTNWKIRTALGLMFVLQWDTPTRWLWFYPAHTDPMLWVFLLGGLILLNRLQNLELHGSPRPLLIGLCALSFFGVLFREVAIIIPLVLLFLYNPLTKIEGIVGTLKAILRPKLVYFAPLLWGIMALVLLKKLVSQDAGFSFVGTARQLAYTKPVLTYMHGWFLAFGPVLFVLLYRWRSARSFLREHQFMAVYLLFFAIMGYLGGTDTERLLYWSMPVVFVLLGRALEDCKSLLTPAPVLALLISAQLLASRALMLTPDYTEGRVSHSIPIFTPMGRNAYFMDLFSFHGTPIVALISFLEYLVFGILLLEWFQYRHRALSKTRKVLYEKAVVQGVVSTSDHAVKSEKVKA